MIFSVNFFEKNHLIIFLSLYLPVYQVFTIVLFYYYLFFIGSKFSLTICS